MSNILLAKLVNGETVIGEEDGKGIKNCYLVFVQPAGQGNMRIGLVGYFAPFQNETDNVDFDESKIMGRIEASGDLMSAYLEKKTGIKVETSSIIS